MKPVDRISESSFSWLFPLMIVVFIAMGLFMDSQRFECFGGAILVTAGMYSQKSDMLREYKLYAAELEKERDDYRHKYYSAIDKIANQQRKHL